jgi:DNA polymerase/3'-5' exonuclease PolX
MVHTHDKKYKIWLKNNKQFKQNNFMNQQRSICKADFKVQDQSEFETFSFNR